MALKKSFLTVFKIEADYWRLNAISFSKPDNVIFFTLCLFPCHDTAADGAAPLESKNFSFNPENEDWEADIRKACYAHAKASDEFADAEDC